jgi:hypothetical protein
MQYVKQFIDNCLLTENNITTPIYDIIYSYSYWLTRCYIGKLINPTSEYKWKSILKSNGFIVNNDIILNGMIKEEEDWEYVSSIQYNCFIYLIENTDTGHIKIGVSRKPHRRLKQLQTGNHIPLKMLGTIQVGNAFEVESIIHKVFSKSRVHGEWFNINRDEIDYLSSYFLESK